MKLYRMDNENSKYDYNILKENNNIFDEYEKMKIIQNLSHNWNEKLKIDFKVPKSLYNYSLTELKLLEKKYINDEIIIESIQTVENEPLIENSQSNELCEKLNKCLSELKDKHLTNEAVKDIRIEGSDIVFDVLCETEIHSDNVYDGVNIRFNKLCEIHDLINIETAKIKEFIENKMIEDCGQYNYSWLVTEFMQFLTKNTMSSYLLMEFTDLDFDVIDKILQENFHIIYDAATTELSKNHNLNTFENNIEDYDDDRKIYKEYYKHNIDFVNFINEMKQYK
jgi:hypothetical protein